MIFSHQFLFLSQNCQVLLANDPSTYDLTGLTEIYNSISNQIFQHLDEGKTNKRLYLRFNNLAANICENLILVALREANFDLAVKVIKFCVTEKNVMPGQLRNESLNQYTDVCIDLGDAEKAIEAVEYSVDTRCSDALQLGLRLAEKLELNDDQCFGCIFQARA